MVDGLLAGAAAQSALRVSKAGVLPAVRLRKLSLHAGERGKSWGKRLFLAMLAFAQAADEKRLRCAHPRTNEITDAFDGNNLAAADDVGCGEQRRRCRGRDGVAVCRESRWRRQARVRVAGPQTGHAFGWAWKRRLFGSSYSPLARRAHLKPRMLEVFARS